MRSLLVLAALVILPSCAACAVRPASTRPAPATLTPAPARAPGSIDIEARDEELAAVVERIAALAGRTIVVEPNIEARVTVALVDLPWREALDVIAALTGCEVEERGAVLVVTQPLRITVQNDGVRHATLLLLASAYAGIALQVLPGLEDRTCALDFVDVPVRELLARIAADAGAIVVLSPDGARGVAGPEVVRGRVVGHDDASLSLRLDASSWSCGRPGSTLELAIPAGPDGDAVRDALRDAREGDLLAVRCGIASGDRLLSGPVTLLAREVIGR